MLVKMECSMLTSIRPVAGPLGRSAYAGRNWEGFSPDPYLTGVAMEVSLVSSPLLVDSETSESSRSESNTVLIIPGNHYRSSKQWSPSLRQALGSLRARDSTQPYLQRHYRFRLAPRISLFQPRRPHHARALHVAIRQRSPSRCRQCYVLVQQNQRNLRLRELQILERPPQRRTRLPGLRPI